MLLLRPNLPISPCSTRGEGWVFFAILSFLCLGLEKGVTQNAAAVSLPGASVTNAPWKQIGPGLFELGQVRFDKTNRAVTFPATVNLREGNIEYVVVTATGKTHESLLRTTAEPLHVQLALLLLGARGAGTNVLTENRSEPLPGDQVEVEISWKTDGRNERFRAEDFVHDRKAGRPASRGVWIYNGSRLREDGFAAQLDGSILSLITDAGALINNPRPGREDDDNWLVRTNHLPALHAPVEVTVKLIR